MLTGELTAVEDAGGLGMFISGLVGLDRSAAKDAFADFLDSARYGANQIEFVNLVIGHLSDHGVIEARPRPGLSLNPPDPAP